MTDSRAAWERVERELRSSMADKEEQLAAMSSQLNSLEAEMSNLRASNDQLTQHNTDCQRLMADRETQSAQLKAQVGKKKLSHSYFMICFLCELNNQNRLQQQKLPNRAQAYRLLHLHLVGLGQLA